MNRYQLMLYSLKNGDRACSNDRWPHTLLRRFSADSPRRALVSTLAKEERVEINDTVIIYSVIIVPFTSART